MIEVVIMVGNNNVQQNMSIIATYRIDKNFCFADAVISYNHSSILLPSP